MILGLILVPTFPFCRAPTWRIDQASNPEDTREVTGMWIKLERRRVGRGVSFIPAVSLSSHFGSLWSGHALIRELISLTNILKL